jgi:hypothetical protein
MLKLNIFILEDTQERIDWFKKQFDNHYLTIAEYVNEPVCQCLKDRKFDLIFLDHDLEDHLTRPTNVKTGNTLAKYLVKNNLQSQAIFYVHSMNPIGANNIVRTLNDAGYEVQWLPYHLLRQCGEEIL